MYPMVPTPVTVKKFTLDDEKSTLPSKQKFFDLLRRADENLQVYVAGLMNPEQTEASEKLKLLVNDIREMINELPDETQRSFYDQEVFCKAVNGKIQTFKSWLESNGSIQMARKVKDLQRVTQRQVRKLTSMATN